MDENLTDRVARVEQRLDLLQRELDAERAGVERRRRRESWIRIALVILIAAFYALYFRGLTSF